jgi:aminoglycoside 6'-N-acetyltransferase I
VFFAQSEGRAIGMVIVSIVDDYRAYAFNRPRGYVNGVFVVPEYRRLGIARAMMLIGLQWLRERGCVVVRLRSSEDGRALYTSLGFAPGTEMELTL